MYMLPSTHPVATHLQAVNHAAAWGKAVENEEKSGNKQCVRF
jgi:hypothetical protein